MKPTSDLHLDWQISQMINYGEVNMARNVRIRANTETEMELHDKIVCCNCA